MVDTELKEGKFVAVYSIEEPFFLAKVVNASNRHKIKITWLEKHSVDKNGTKYNLSYNDFIQKRNIIVEVTLRKITRFRFLLSKDEEMKILSLLKDQSTEDDETDDMLATVPNSSFDLSNILHILNFNEIESLFNGRSIEINEQQKKILLGESELVPKIHIISNVVLENCIQYNETHKHLSEENTTTESKQSYLYASSEQYTLSENSNSPSISNCPSTSKYMQISDKDQREATTSETTKRRLQNTTKNEKYLFNGKYEGLDSPTTTEPYLSSGSEYIPETDVETDVETDINIPLLKNITFPLENSDVINSNHEKPTEFLSKELEKNIFKKLDNKNGKMEKAAESSSKESSKDATIIEKKSPTLSLLKELNKDMHSSLEGIHSETEEETGSLSEESDEVVIVKCTKKTSMGARIYDKKHICYFCNKPLSKITRHLVDVHSNETEVARLLALPENSVERREGFLLILRAGDYYHNVEVLSTKRGELILSRRPSDNRKLNYRKFGPCPECLGFFLTTNLWHHVKNYCPKKSNLTMKIDNQNISRRDVKGESYALLGQNSNLSKDFCFHILAHFKDDIVGNTCRQDEVIIKFGAMLYEKYSEHQHEYVRQCMRQLSRLLLETKRLNPSIKDLKEIMYPKNFDLLISSVQQLCIVGKTENNTRFYNIPSLALKIGHNLRKCALIVRGTALRQGDLKVNREMESFLELMTLEWNAKISSSALRTLKEKKMNATLLLPITADILKLNQFLDSIIKDFVFNKKVIVSPKDWQHLAQATLCRIVLFNKRRSGEAARMTLHQYAVRPSWTTQCTSELKDSLTPLETNLANNLTMVEVPGKSRKNFKVPILLTNDTKLAIDKLIETRSMSGISKNNIYVFARGCGSQKPLRGHDSLRKFAKEANLQQPSSLTSTKLRKYIATVIQILNLKENEYDWLARHLGHDIRIHREFYRLHESAVELTKISRLLLTLDKGEINKFKGKSLDDIDVSELPNIESEPENFEESTDDEKGERNDELREMGDLEEDLNDYVETTKEIQMNETGNNAKSERSQPLSKKTKTKYTGKHLSKIKNVLKSAEAKKRKAWTSEEKEVLVKFFRIHIKKSIIPKKENSEKCLLENPSVFQNRSWKDIKYWIYNKINSLKKEQSKM